MAKLPSVFIRGTMNDVGIHNAGAIAVEDTGIPPTSADSHLTFILLPGMGDLRQSYRYLGPLLYEAGHRVLVADLRGHGESSSGFPSYSPLDVSNDIATILKFFKLKKGVILVGNSLSGSSVLRVAATHPDIIKAVIGLAPVCRDLSQDHWFRPLSYVLFFWAWGVPAWIAYYKSLFKKNLPEDIREYSNTMRTILSQKGRLFAVAEMGRGSKQPCFMKAEEVKCPVLLIFGEKDPDFSNPLEEAHEVSKSLSSTRTKYEIISGVGHYPHVEEPGLVLQMITDFLRDI